MEISRQRDAFAFRLADDGVVARSNAQAEIASARVYVDGKGWVPLPDAKGKMVTAATMNFDLAEDLAGEFDDWYEQNKEAQELELMPERGGPIGSWENIEKFFKDRYPAAYQGFTKAYEQAPLALDYNGYDTGPEAIAKHGYDPLEVAASMFYLHNQSDSARKELEKADEQRIIDVMRKRHEMSQGQNRSATKKLAKDIVLYRGFGLDFREPGMEKIKAITHPHFDAVPGESLVEAYDRSQKDEAEGVYDHPDLGPHILDYLSSGRGPGGYTLGSHWTPDISVAQDWSRHRGRTPVVLKVRIPGDTKKKTFNPGWKYEKEWPMPAGTPVNVEEVHLWNPRDVLWHNVLQEPSVRYANMDPILLAQKTIRVAENNLIDDDEWEIIDKINDHLSNGRPASAVAVWMQNMIPIYHLSRAPEIIHAYERMHPTGTNRTSQQFAEAQASAFDIDTFNAEVAPVLSDLAMQRYTRRVNESYRDNPDFDEDSDDYHDPRITPSNPYGDDDDYDDDDEEEEKEEETDLDGGHYDEVGVFHPEFEHFQKLIDTPSDSRKLKSPWSHRVVHYTTNRPIPQELRGKPKDWDYTGDLYGDFEFGGPAFWDLKDPNYGVYQINHPRDEMHKPPVGYLQYHQTIDADDNPTIHIDYLDTHPNYRLQGVATALMNALAQDYPNHRIDPGFTTEHGTGFTNFMRENAPGAQDRLNTETWSPSSPNVVSDDQMKDWGVKKKRSPVFASLNMIRQAEKILAYYEQEIYVPTLKELDEADHPKSWRQLLKELFHPEDEDAIVKASKVIRASTQVLGR